MCVIYHPSGSLSHSLLPLANYARGIYAVQVKGRVPEDVEAELENRGIKYRPRDQTDQD